MELKLPCPNCQGGGCTTCSGFGYQAFDLPDKGDEFSTLNPLGQLVKCKYKYPVRAQENIHAVQLLEGEYKGVAYKSLEELLPKKPIIDEQKLD